MLEFSNTTTKNGLIQLAEHYTGLGDGNISGDATKLKLFTGLINHWYGVVVDDILKADGRWQYDDPNHTKQPVSTFDLVADQSEYNFTLDEQSNQILRLGYITVKNAAGEWIDLTPIDRSEFGKGSVYGAYSEFEGVSGEPQYFDIQDGTGVKLFPAPNYNSTAGGRVFFTREPSYYVSTDTTKKAGFAGTFHIILALGASYDWGLGKGKANIANLRQEIELMRKDIKSFYSRRNGFEKARLIPRQDSNK